MNLLSGNFGNTTAGLAKMVWGGIDAGFLKKNLKLTYDSETLDFEVGTPSQFIGRIVSKYRMELMAGFAEISARTFGMGSGLGGSSIVTITGGTPVAHAGAAYSVTTLQDGSKGWVFPYAGITTLPVVKSPDGSTTTYVAGTDYTVTAGTVLEPGVIRVIAGSDLEDAILIDPRFWVSYSLDVGSLQRVNPGSSFVFEQKDVIVTHVRPHTSKFVRATIPRMQAKGTWALNFEEGAYQINDFMASAIPVPGYLDPSGNAAPYGWVDFQT